MNLKEGLNKYKKLTREEYFEKNQELSKDLWGAEIPTVGDIANFMKGQTNEKLEGIFEFFDNREDFLKMANRVDNNYEQDESSTFIRKVMSANNDDISRAGYFYKLLMASADDFTIKDKDCNSDGVCYDVSEITEDIFDYRIKFMQVKEFKNFVRIDYDDFIKWCNENQITEIHVRTPMDCNLFKEHKVCKKCAGAVPGISNIGIFTTLMVTEHATQSALSSMNKGRKDNINDVLTLKYDGGRNWDDIVLWITSVVNQLENKNVSARFYEIALLSRVREDEDGPFVSTLKSSIDHSKNLFGAYIFNPSNKNFKKIVKAQSFEDNSLKLQIAINSYKRS